MTHDVDPNERVRTWFSRRRTPDAVVGMAQVADVLRDVADQLHGSEATPDDVEELLALATRLRERTSDLAPAPNHLPGAPVDPDDLTFLDRSPLSGVVNPVAPPMRMTHEGDKVVGRVTFGEAFEGPPGHVHGGWVASGFDEVMGMAQALGSAPGMTARLDVAYRRPTPLGVELLFAGWIDSVRGRKIRTSATLHHGGTLLAEASGLFVSVDFEAFAQRAGEVGGDG